MITMVTGHSAKPGMLEAYVEFLEQKKLNFVRSLPKVSRYQVYRTERRFDPSGMLPEDKRFDIVAIIDYDGSETELEMLFMSDAWVAFMEEYMFMLEEDAPLYIASALADCSG
ncbi:hypothetical protein GCM10017044_18030 [Kordiimonas sediminis]|uniref:Uncharacterized protein n=1 Tax=Kordiimonas sediminis TaxID=1735581 RepID=A0A919AS75_9PROT|nr:hypothetical protein [Kordiimonas sediminis]GHF23853.1 hypothetical protein GCM10017044_18030 [Kordiimonas sediminis]